jgi:hypothetical protein
MKGDYANGRIYKIEPICEHDENEVYYGSTCQLLCKRMDTHRSGYTSWKAGKHNKASSYELFEKYGVENCKIYLVELYPCETKEELFAREGYYIKNNKCVNKNVAGRTSKERYKDNKTEICKNQKQYYEDHWVEINEKQKKYTLENIDKIKEYRQTKNVCNCGGQYTNSDRSKHYKTKMHIKWQNEQELEQVNDV